MARLSIQELAAILIEKNGLEKDEAQRFVTAVFEVIQSGVEKDKLVKVKGLGTFKIIDVDARESVNVNTGNRVLIDSHSKITFTPDSTMKELVNKPFSSFETVVLNEGVEFEDTPVQEESDKEDDTEDDSQILDFVVEEPTPVISEKPAAEITVDLNDKSTENKTANDTEKEDGANIIAKEKSANETVKEETENGTAEVQAANDTIEDVSTNETAEEEPANTVINIDEEKPSAHWWVWVLVAIFSFIIGFAGGIYIGENGILSYASIQNDEQSPLVSDSIDETIVADTMIVAQSTDSLSADTLKEETVDNSAQESVPTKLETAKIDEPEPEYKKYEALDSRVRTGAYYIIGLDKEVEVREGDNLTRISRRYLGEDMSCYVEVYNNFTSNTELKAGQKVRIPKLKLKKLMRD